MTNPLPGEAIGPTHYFQPDIVVDPAAMEMEALAGPEIDAQAARRLVECAQEVVAQSVVGLTDKADRFTLLETRYQIDEVEDEEGPEGNYSAVRIVRRAPHGYPQFYSDAWDDNGHPTNIEVPIRDGALAGPEADKMKGYSKLVLSNDAAGQFQHSGMVSRTARKMMASADGRYAMLDVTVAQESVEGASSPVTQVDLQYARTLNDSGNILVIACYLRHDPEEPDPERQFSTAQEVMVGQRPEPFTGDYRPEVPSPGLEAELVEGGMLPPELKFTLEEWVELVQRPLTTADYLRTELSL